MKSNFSAFLKLLGKEATPKQPLVQCQAPCTGSSLSGRKGETGKEEVTQN